MMGGNNRPETSINASLDGVLARIADCFAFLANLCLLAMLVGTSATILLRPFAVSFYWIWPWTLQFFVWMSFFAYFVVYRRKKDVTVDFVAERLGPLAMKSTRILAGIVVLAVNLVILAQMPTILAVQEGVVDGVVTPWGELPRYSLSIPLAASAFLVIVDTIVDLAKAASGEPEIRPTMLDR